MDLYYEYLTGLVSGCARIPNAVFGLSKSFESSLRSAAKFWGVRRFVGSEVFCLGAQLQRALIVLGSRNFG